MRYCPTCGNMLDAVRQSSNSPLNSEQFGSIRAGDYYCPVCVCPEEERRGKTAYRYFWKWEVEDTPVMNPEQGPGANRGAVG